MTIKVKISTAGPEAVTEEPEIKVTYDPKAPAEPDAIVSLKMSKNVDGTFVIKDHDYFDIFILPEKKRIVTIPKMGMGEGVYQHQKSYLDALMRRGALISDSIEGGMVYGTLQSRLGESEEVSPIQVVLYETERYMKEYRVENQLAKEYEEAIEDRFTSPTDEESTDSGEIDPEEKRRSHEVDIPYYSYAGYGYMF
jgi:hypothetical protein